MGQKTRKKCLVSEDIVFNSPQFPVLITVLLVELKTFISLFLLLCSFYDTRSAEARDFQVE